MPNTYSQIYIHLIFAVKHREALIRTSWEEELYKYITGIVQNKEQKLFAIGGTSNHIYFLIGMKPSCCLSDLVREIKKSTNEFIKSKKFCKSKFNWQEGFGAFSCGHSQLDTVVKYIMNQKEHHKVKTFSEEYIRFIQKHNITHEEKYLFEWND